VFLLLRHTGIASVNAPTFPTTAFTGRPGPMGDSRPSRPADGRLLARHKRKQTLMKQLRPYLPDAAAYYQQGPSK